MRKSSLLLATTLCAAFSASVLVPQAGAFTPEELKCRGTVFKTAGKLAKLQFGFFDQCHELRGEGEVDALRPCNSVGYADLDNKYFDLKRKSEGKFRDQCDNLSTASMLYEECPAPCDALQPPTDTNRLISCVECLLQNASEGTSDEAAGNPTPPLGSAESSCHSAITRADGKLFTTVLKRIGSCQKKIDKLYPGDVTTCLGVHFPERIAPDTEDCVEAVSSDCAAVTLPSATLDACGGAGTAGELASCVCNTARDNAVELAGHFIETDLPDPPPPPTTTTMTTLEPTTTTTNTLPEGDPDCPDVADLVFYSRDSETTCTSNTDCSAPRTCDTDTGLCSTVTDVDNGWTGLAHDLDTNDGDRVRVHLNCAGPGPVCGQCDVVAIDSGAGNCRCRNDSRVTCDQALAHDNDDCGGETCDCYLGAPRPVSMGGVPACIVDRVGGQLSGTINVDTGAVAIDTPVRQFVYLGEATRTPCPVCGGKCSDDSSACGTNADCGVGPTCNFDTPKDGNRDGVCVGGQSDGLSCDATAANASFPALPDGTGGGLYSLDCMPDLGRNVSGPGLKIELEESTASDSLASNLDCGGSGTGLDCACLACTTDRTVGCDSDSDCSSQPSKCSGANITCDTNADCENANVGTCTAIGNTRCTLASSVQCHGNNAECHGVDVGICVPSTCSSRGNGEFPLPNNCEDLLCSDLGDGNGKCTTGPDLQFCDAVIKADGAGVLSCSTNDDCLPDIQGVDGGTCGITTRSSCFLDPIVAAGSADPAFPVTASVTCSPPSSNTGVNAVTGLPGPVRRVTQRSLTSLCASDHGTAYTPGAGGCP